MSYLKLNHSRIILACFLVSSVLLWRWPGVDLQVSRYFYEMTPSWDIQFWGGLMHDGIGYCIGVALAFLLGLYVFNRLTNRSVCGLDGKRTLYPFLVLILGAGLIVNVILKDNVGRARPRDIEQFGGLKRFTPALVISHECKDNCSFSSGDGAGAFFGLSLALVLGRKRWGLIAACSFGVVVSYFRVATGAHFLSDVLFSFFVMLILTDVLYHYLILPTVKVAGPVDVRETGLVATFERN